MPPLSPILFRVTLCLTIGFGCVRGYQVVEEGDFLFFHSSGSRDVHRYHLPSKDWFQNWTFDDQVWGIAAHQGLFYSSHEGFLSKRVIETEIDAIVTTQVSQSNALAAAGDWVFLVSEISDETLSLKTVNNSSGGLVDELNVESRVFSQLTLLNGDPSYLYFYLGDWNTASIWRLEISAGGTFGEFVEVAKAPGGGSEYLFNGELHAVDDGALIFDTLGRAIKGRVLSPPDQLNRYSNALTEVDDYYALAGPGLIWLAEKEGKEVSKKTLFQKNMIHLKGVGDSLIVFYTSPVTTIGADIVSVEDFEPIIPPSIPPTESRQFLPSPGWIDKNDVIYLPEVNFGAEKTIHRWDLKTRSFLPPFRLLEDTFDFTYHAHDNSLYAVYGRGHVSRIDLDDPDLKEVFVLKEESNFAGIMSAGDHLIIDYNAYDENLKKIQRLPGFPKNHRLWGNDKKRVYTIQENQVYWSERLENGSYSEENGPRPFGFLPSVDPDPVFSPDGELVFLAGGTVMNTENFVQVRQLPNINKDFEWYDGRLYSIRQDSVWIYNNEPYPKFSEVRRWNSGYQVERSKKFPGRPIQLLSSSKGLVLSVETSGQLRFYLLDKDLNILYASNLSGDLELLKLDSRSPTKLQLEFRRSGEDPRELDLDYFDSDLEAWVRLETFGNSFARRLFTELSPETDFHFRIAGTLKEQRISYLDRISVTRFGMLFWVEPTQGQHQYRIQAFNQRTKDWEDAYAGSSAPDNPHIFELDPPADFQPLNARIQFKEFSDSEWNTSTLGTALAIRTRFSSDEYLGTSGPFVFQKRNAETDVFEDIASGFITPSGAVFENDHQGLIYPGYDVVRVAWEEPKAYQLLTVKTPSLNEATTLSYTLNVEAEAFGTVIGNDKSYGYGELIDIKAVPVSGYLFGFWDGLDGAERFKESLQLSADINLYLRPRFIPEDSWEEPVIVIEVNRQIVSFSAITKKGIVYTIQVSDDMTDWHDLAEPRSGNDAVIEWEFSHDIDKPARFYRLWAHPGDL